MPSVWVPCSAAVNNARQQTSGLYYYCISAFEPPAACEPIYSVLTFPTNSLILCWCAAGLQQNSTTGSVPLVFSPCLYTRADFDVVAARDQRTSGSRAGTCEVTLYICDRCAVYCRSSIIIIDMTINKRLFVNKHTQVRILALLFRFGGRP